jgi:predicted RNA binding protein YcfA (HicA-like mRNA interferase family)
VSQWPSTRARLVYKALLKIGWKPVHQRGSHIKLRNPKFAQPYAWSFRGEELGQHILARIAKRTGLKPEDL